MYELFGVGVIFPGTVLLLIGMGWLIRNAYRTRRWLAVLLAVTVFLGTPLSYGLIRLRLCRDQSILRLDAQLWQRDRIPRMVLSQVHHSGSNPA